MSIRKSLASAMQFAHLVTPRAAAAAPVVAPGAAQAAASADDDDMKKLRQQADDAEKRAADAEKRADDAEEKAKKGKKASGEAAASEEDDEDDDEDGDEDGDREEAALPAGNRVRSARLRERHRCAAIFAEPAAGLNPVLAAQLAFAGDLPRGQAVSILKAAGAGRGPGLAARMEANKTPLLAPDQPPAPAATDPKAIADGVLTAYRDARGIKS